MKQLLTKMASFILSVMLLLYSKPFIYDTQAMELNIQTTSNGIGNLSQNNQSGDSYIYLPVVFWNDSPLLVADFNNCRLRNNLGGQMGSAYSDGNYLAESFIEENSERRCTLKLTYRINNWSAFWLKLQSIDLTNYERLVFDIRAAQQDQPSKLKIELKRENNKETSVVYLSGITSKWQTLAVYLSDFKPTRDIPPLSSFTDMEELVFTFEVNQSGKTGTIFLDNIFFER